MGNSTINILPVWRVSTKKNKIFCYLKLIPFPSNCPPSSHVTKEQVDSMITFDLTEMLAVYLFIWKYLSVIIKNALHCEIFYWWTILVILSDITLYSLWGALMCNPWASKFIVNRRFLYKLILYYDVKKIDSFNLAFLLKGGKQYI